MLGQVPTVKDLSPKEIKDFLFLQPWDHFWVWVYFSLFVVHPSITHQYHLHCVVTTYLIAVKAKSLSAWYSSAVSHSFSPFRTKTIWIRLTNLIHYYSSSFSSVLHTEQLGKLVTWALVVDFLISTICHATV